MQKITDKYVTINNIKTRYWQLGDKGSPILLIHGFAGSVEHWMENIEALAKHYKVYAVDMIGFGFSDKPQDIKYTPVVFTEFIKAFLDYHKLNKINMVGHSFGGAIALHFAIKYPQLIDKLTLVSSAGLGNDLPLHFRLLTLPIIGRILLGMKSKTAIAKALRHHVYNPKTLSQNFINRMCEVFKQPRFSKTMHKILRTYANFCGIRPEATKDIIAALPNIKIPTLIIWGQEDNLLPVKHAYFAAKKIPNAKLHIFKYCRHLPQFEYSQDFNKQVLKFID